MTGDVQCDDCLRGREYSDTGGDKGIRVVERLENRGGFTAARRVGIGEVEVCDDGLVDKTETL